MTKHEIKQRAFCKLQNRIAKKCKNDVCLILKGGYFYRDDYKGYTELIQYAGVYNLHDALLHVTRCSWTDFIRIVPLDAAKHNELIISEIKKLTAHLI